MLVTTNNDVIQKRHFKYFSARRKTPGELAVLKRRFNGAARVVVCNHKTRGIEFEQQAKDIAWVHEARVDGSAENHAFGEQ